MKRINSNNSLHANQLAKSLGRVKLDSDKWKLWKNLLIKQKMFLNLVFGQVGEEKSVCTKVSEGTENYHYKKGLFYVISN
jgi:hypothetical protein